MGETQESIGRMGEQNVVHMYDGMLLGLKKEGNSDISFNMDELEDIMVNENKTKRQMLYDFTYMGIRASLVAQTVKNLPAMWETWVRPLSWEDPLKKGKATHSSILAWRIPWTEEPGRLQSTGLRRVRHD